MPPPADEFAPRTFYGDANPPPRASNLILPAEGGGDAVAAAPTGIAAEGALAAGGTPAGQAMDLTPRAKAKGGYRVVDTPNRGRRMFYISETGETVDRGEVLATDEALNSVGQYYQSNKSWNVPESYALKFERGDPGFADHVVKSFTGAQAGMHRGLVGYLAITKQMPYDEALSRTEPDLVRAQLADLPRAAWGDTRLQKVVGASKWALGAVAEAIPGQLGSLETGAKSIPTVAAVATGVAATGGPAGLSALASPAGALTTLGVALKVGAFDFTSKETTGNLALDMRAKGIDPATIETVAPLAGMFAGALEVLHVKYLPAPFRRAVMGKVLGSEVAKKAMTSWAMNYFKEVGAEVSVEVVQQYIENFAVNMMAQIDVRPDVAKTVETMNAEALKVAAKTAVGLGLLKAPGAGFEAVMSRPEAAPAPAATAPTATTAAESPKKSAAAAVETELVADSPEVAQTLTQLNETLDPTAPEAEAVYTEMGAELAGDENAAVAVTAKVEALRMEMNDILAEEANTPAEQRRVAEIQNEIGLLEGMQQKMAETPQPVEDLPVIDTQWAESNQTAAPKESKFVEGARFRDAFGDEPYIYESRYVDPKELLANLNMEGRTYEEVVKMPTTQKYIEWYRQGKIPPPIDVVISDSGPKSVNRRRVVAAIEAGVAKIPANVEVGRTKRAAKRPISAARAKVQKQVVAAREKKLISDLNNTLAMVKELESARSRLEKAGKSTTFINDKIVGLMENVYKIDAERIALAEGNMPASDAALELKPATIVSITKTAFKEGRKDVITRRAELLKEVAEANGLTDRDVKTLVRNRNLGVMTDLDFKKFIDTARVAARALAEKKQAFTELRAAQEAKGLKHEESLRRINNLPPVSKMTAEQMRTYAELIEGYEAGDTFWTEKRIEALKNTRWEGSETMGDVLKKAAELFNVPLEDLGKVTVSEFDRFRYDTALARRHPLFNFMVDEVKTAVVKNEAAYFAAREEHFALAEAAAKSRGALDAGKKSVWERLANWAAPQQAELMAYLEAQTPEEKAAAASALTPEELKLAEFEEKFYADAYDYLLAGKDLASSRFADGGYVFHARRPISEILRGIPETGIRAAVSDIINSWKMDETKFNVVDQKTGAPLGLRKFFRQTLFRSGEMTPSKNVLRSTDIYMRQFFRKKALDEAVPSVETLVKAVVALNNQTEEGKQMGAALESFVRDYLNAKKGKAAMLGVVQGGQLDALIRFATSTLSFMTMGANTVIQAAAPVGEAAAKTVALGYRAYGRALARRATAKGRAIAKKYEFFTGEGVIEEFMQPGQNIETRIMMLAYGMFKWSRVNTMKDLLLGSMTEAEYEAGEISAERLAQIKKDAGRWLDIGDAKSVYGTTSVWKAETQFKSWAIPIMSSSLDILDGLIKSAAKGKNVLTPQQQSEILRIAMTTSLVTLAAAMAGDADKNDDSYLGRLKFTVMREMTTLILAMNPLLLAGGPAAFAWMFRLAQNIQLMLELEKVKGTDELRGWKNLKKQLTPGGIKTLTAEKKRPKKLMEGGR